MAVNGRQKQPQAQPRSGIRTEKRLTRLSRHSKALETPILEIDELEYLPLEDEPAFRQADRYHHRQPGDGSEEDVEHVEAEITELFRCADRL